MQSLQSIQGMAPVSHPTPETRFGVGGPVSSSVMPFSVKINENQLLNRFVIDTLGYSSWSVIIARNNFERLENALDWAGWLSAGLVIPYVVERGVNRFYHSKYLAKKYGNAGIIKNAANRNTLLSMPFEWLDKAKHSNTLARLTQGKSRKKAEQFGLTHFKHLTPDLAKSILWGKLLIVWIDLLLLASKNQGYAWIKNWVTEELSGQKGFSGEFKYANKEYLESQSAGYEKTKDLRKIASLSIGFGGALLFPLALLGVLRSKKTKGAMGWLKERVKAFNYTDAIFMSKWVLLSSNLTNWAPATILSSRDKHEMREKITRMLAFDFFFFFGDDLISGVAAKVLQRKHKLDAAIVRKGKWTGLPRAIPLHEVYAQVEDKTSMAYKLARRSFWIGLLGTAAALGVTMPLLNFWFTKKKVMAEQGQMKGVSSATGFARNPMGKYQPLVRRRPLMIENTVYLQGQNISYASSGR
ncbi:MAG: hypothetical protein KTR14_04760 [Vampirovibrio sp.]|nr:hypothetical protein [Vampirovibrio sp.]